MEQKNVHEKDKDNAEEFEKFTKLISNPRNNNRAEFCVLFLNRRNDFSLSNDLREMYDEELQKIFNLKYDAEIQKILFKKLIKSRAYRHSIKP